MLDDSKLYILLFERDPDTIKIIQSGLSDVKYVIEPVLNVFSGMKTIMSSPPDFIIANCDFPELSGFELLKKIKDSGNNTPVILYGPKSDEAILNAFRAGSKDYWPKPLFGKELKERLEIVRAQMAESVSTKEVQFLKENLNRERKELRNLLEITNSLNVSGDTKISLSHLTDHAAESMSCEAASIMLINERENVLEFIVASGEKKHKLETIKVPMGEGIAGWVAMQGKPQVVNDTKTDSRFTGKVDAESGFVTKQILAVPMILDSEVIGVLEVINTKNNRHFTNNDLRILNDMAERIATVISATRKIEDQQNFFIQTTNILVKAIEKKDVFTEGHSWKVAEYAHKIGIFMNLSNMTMNDLHFAALLHDIGKLVMPSYVFNKRDLSDRERELLRQHPVLGAKLLESITLWKSVVPCVLYHHESWDGCGYPSGLKGKDIPICSRIINLTEAYSIMSSPNTYKKQMTLKETILELMRCSGKQFDPEVVKVFMGILEKEHTPR